MSGMLVRIAIIAVVLLCFFAPSVQANLITFEAFLTGSGETPPNASPATGFGIVVFNDVLDSITVDLSWSGLTAPATAAHIHGPGAPGTNAPVIFPFSGVPAATAGAIPEQTFAINPTQIGYLETGVLYLNVHTSTFPGGEIRGQLTSVAEPASTLLLGCSLFGLWKARRKL